MRCSGLWTTPLRVCVCATVLCGFQLKVCYSGEFHGLNAGAPVWNGSVLLPPQAAAAFAATGTEAIRVNFRLDSGTSSWDATQLALYDQVISNARGAGLNVLGLFSNETVAGGQAAWNDDTDGDGMNDYVSSFASTAQLLIDRYQNDIQQFELWNEPNAWTNPGYVSDPQNAGGTYILPRVYANLLSETYRSLDSASLVGPGGVELATGGLFAHDIGGSFSTAVPYMQQVYDQSAVWSAFQGDFDREYPWDKFGYHFYISQGTPLQVSQIDGYFDSVRNAQNLNSDPADVIVTEFSWQTVGANTQQLQRDNMATAYDYMESQSYITGTYWYQWTDDITGAWGLVDGVGSPKLSYHEFVARNGGPPSVIRAATEHAASDAQLSQSPSSTDLLQGLIATELPGDNGWHSANPASGDPGDPNGLPAFTDGQGDLGAGVTGLLNDFPGAGAPTKTIQYDLGNPHDISEIRLFTGNQGQDGRAFSTVAVYTSEDGAAFDLLGYFQSDPSGTVNAPESPGGAFGATLLTISHQESQPLAESVTDLRFDFFATSDLQGVMRDPFSGVSPFTGTDDGLGAAFVSPLVREIDVFGAASATRPGDYNSDGVVDAVDYAVWREHLGQPLGALANDAATPADGETIGQFQFTQWQDNYGAGQADGAWETSSSRVPEPAGWALLLVAGLIRSPRCLEWRASNTSRISPSVALNRRIS